MTEIIWLKTINFDCHVWSVQSLNNHAAAYTHQHNMHVDCWATKSLTWLWYELTCICIYIWLRRHTVTCTHQGHVRAWANVHVYHDYYTCRGIMVTFCFTFCSILTECSEIQCQIFDRNNRDVVRKNCNLYNTFIFPDSRKLLTESNCSYILHIEYIYLVQYLWNLLTMKILMHLLSVSMMTMLASEERLFGGKYVGNWSSNEQLLQIET